jgi:asparagine synthase (glutamine-hydrolysing)
MCGIVGIWSKESLPERGDFADLLSALAHRGPDDHWSSTLHNLYYGSTRLAIVNTSVPLKNDSESDSTDVLLNGEIWNYRDLAAQHGVAEPVSERRVIRELYEKLGKDFVCHLDGVFALVIVDRLREEVHIYRDPVGVKPIFCWIDSSQRAFIFSSDAKTICQWKQFNPEINEHYLMNEYVVGFSDYEENLFKGVRQIRPCSSLTLSIRGGSLRPSVSEYVSSRVSPRPMAWSEENQFDALQRAVWHQYQHCDYLPIGLLLSGGIDSSLLLFIARSMGLRDVVCFYCGTDTSPDYFFANRVAREAGYEIRHFTLSAPQIWPELASSCYCMSGTNSLLPHVCRKIKGMSPEIRVLWSGEGADELFGGYPCHGSATELLESWKRKMAQTSLRTSLMTRIEQIWTERLKELDRRTEVFRLYMDEQLVNAHLVPHDYAGMAVSVEIRLPFLDLHNVEMSRCMPATLVLGSERKVVLKSLLRRLSGISEDSFYDREKMGLLHGYIDVIHDLRQMAYLLQRNHNWTEMETGYFMGPFQRIWYQLVSRVFVGTKRCSPNASYTGPIWHDLEVPN